MYNMIILYIM